MEGVPGQESMGVNVLTNINSNSLGNTEAPGGLSIYQIIGIIVIFTIFASIVSYSRNMIRSGFEQTRDWIYQKVPFLNKKTVPSGVEDSGLSLTKLIYPNKNEGAEQQTQQTNSVSPPEPEPAASSDQTWCLVGEDMAGRWCVQVPSIKACESDRAYDSRNKCEKGTK